MTNEVGMVFDYNDPRQKRQADQERRRNQPQPMPVFDPLALAQPQNSSKGRKQ